VTGFLSTIRKEPHPFELVLHEDVHPTTAAFLQLLREAGELSIKKGKDYGTDSDPDANLTASEDFGIPSWVGCLSRANDKMRRLQTFATSGALANEGAEDSMLDLAVYALKALRFYRDASGEGS
jgi:hypothetical protein